MTDNQPELSRRQVLAAIGGVTAVGTTTGLGTSAYLSDRFQSTQQLGAGTVSVELDCDSCETIDGRLGFALEDIEPGSGWNTEEFTLTVPEDANPIRLWMRTTCPPVVDPLGDALEVRVTGRDCNSGQNGSQLVPVTGYSTLAELRREVSDGIRVDTLSEPCLGPGEQLCLSFEYRLPAGATWASGSQTDLELEFYAEQCRHVSDSQAPETPFATGTCPELECPECIELGKVDVDGDRLIPGETYPLDTDGYEIEVRSATDKADTDGTQETVCVAFRLLKDGSEAAAPPVCRVDVGGGRPRPPPNNPDSRVATYEVHPPLTRTRGEVCAAHGEDKADPTSVPDGDRPGISNITVFVCESNVPDAVRENECSPCEANSENWVTEATFEYEGPDAVTVVFEQAGSNGGEEPPETISVSGVESQERITVPLNGQTEFEVAVFDGETAVDLGKIHTSCAEPFGPGLKRASDKYSLTVIEAFDKEGQPICEVSQ